MVGKTGYIVFMKRRYSPEFIKSLKKADVRTRKSFRERIVIFAKNPNDSQLNNHVLTKEWQGHRSIDINADYRAIYEEVIMGEDRVAYFVTLGTHDQLYKSNSD